MQKVLFIEAGGCFLKGLERELEASGTAVFLASGIGSGLKVAREIAPNFVVVGTGSETPSFDFLEPLKENLVTGGGLVLLLHEGDADAVAKDSHVQAFVDLLLPYPVNAQILFDRIEEVGRDRGAFHSKELSDKSLATVLEETRDFVILTDEQLKEVFYMNTAAREGLDLEDHLGQPCPKWLKDIYPREVFQTLLKSIQESLNQGKVWRGETQLNGANGGPIPVSQQVHLHVDLELGLRYVSLVIRDITELKMTQQSLEQQEAFYRLITENTSDLIGLFDSKGENVYSSPSYEKLLGFASWELEGQGVYDCIHHDDRDRVRNIVLATLQTGKEVILQYRMTDKRDTVLHFEATTGGIRDAAGRFERLIVVSRDITSQVRQREERELMELHHLHAQKMESIGQLAAGVAHEMNTPIQYFGDNLRFIRDSFSDIFMVLKVYHEQFRQLCRKGYDPHKIQELERAWAEADADFLFKEIPKSIDQSLQGVANLAHIVGAMKEFSHPGADNKIPINFNQVIENTLTIARNEWKYIAAVKLDLDETLPPVSCLPDEIRQMLLNLIINACHAIEGKGLNPEEKGTIRISTTLVQQEVPMVELRVQDSGTGIPDEVRNRIFEPFFTTKPVGKGTGQGLAIVHNVVIDKHSGQLHVESAVNKGTTFIICLPVNPPHSKEPE